MTRASGVDGSAKGRRGFLFDLRVQVLAAEEEFFVLLCALGELDPEAGTLCK